MISTRDANDGREEAPSDGIYTGTDGFPHKIRKGDSIPDGTTFAAKSGEPAVSFAGTGAMEPAATPSEPEPEPDPLASKKFGRRGPSETTDAAGPSETS